MSVGGDKVDDMTTPTAAVQAELDALTEAFASAMPALDAALAALSSAAVKRPGEGTPGEAAPGEETPGEPAPGDEAPGEAHADDGRAGTPGPVDQVFERMSSPGLVRVLESATRLRRRVDAILTRVADEVAKRSGPEFGTEGLAKQRGFANPARLIASLTGGTPAEASRFISVGAATRTRSSFAGEPLPPKHPHARRGLDDGSLSLDAAAMITSMLARVTRRAEPDLLDRCESTLVVLAGSSPLSLLSRAVTLAESRLDPDGIEPADEALHEGRSLTLREDANGMLHLRGVLDPITGAPIKTALDALVSDALRRRDRRAGDRYSGSAGPHGSEVPAGAPAAARARANDGASAGVSAGVSTGVSAGAGTAAGTATGTEASAGAEPVIEDRRSIPQLQADALAQLAQHALGCTDAPTPLITTTIVVRMSLEALRDGHGTAEIDGIDRRIAARTARRLAVDTELIPMVLGADSVPLDLGRAARLFSRHQRLALAERDGGCASCGQNITYAQAHHIRWWSTGNGPTDLDNGVLLCSTCHHRIHSDGWQIHATPTEVWFIPPPHIDPEQRPRQGGRARFDPMRPRTFDAPPGRAATPPATLDAPPGTTDAPPAALTSPPGATPAALDTPPDGDPHDAASAVRQGTRQLPAGVRQMSARSSRHARRAAPVRTV